MEEYDVIYSDWTHNFRNINMQDSDEKGVCYTQTKQVWITLHLHESIEDIFDTIIHESLHQAITDKTVGEDESENMGIEQEHELIKRVRWVLNDWIFFE